MRLSIVFPAYNEANRLGPSLERVVAYCEAELDEYEILVVDDGSKDDTSEIARSFPGVRCLRNEENLGKGGSVRRGMLEARLDPVLFSDVDLSTPIEEAGGLLRAIEAGADVAIASRHARDDRVKRTMLRRLMAGVFRLVVRLVAIRGIEDTQCGFKMFRRAAAREIFPRGRLDGWAFDVEVLFLARRLGYRIREVPVAWSEAEESRLTLWSPVAMLIDLFRIRWYQLLGRYRRPSAGGG